MNMNKNYKILDKKCPCCGHPLVGTWFFDTDFLSPEQNKLTEVCKNRECRGWYCEYDGRWHSYLTMCSVVMVRNYRSDTDYPENYWQWKANLDKLFPFKREGWWSEIEGDEQSPHKHAPDEIGGIDEGSEGSGSGPSKAVNELES